MDNLPSPHFHTPFVRAFDRDHGASPIDLSEDALLVQSQEGTGDVGDVDGRFLPALRVLLAALESEAGLSPFGRFNARSRLVHSLKNQRWASRCFADRPEIRHRRIHAPIVIVGPHRSGTTRLQRMLAADARLQHLKTWEGINPAPRLREPDAGRAARRDEAIAMLSMRHRAYESSFTVHPMDADWPEEEMLLMNHAFHSFSLFGFFGVPSYYRWFLDTDKSAAYAYLADLLNLVSWARQGDDGKRWILKNPQHMLDLPALMTQFPDAKLIFTHRDPIKTVGSMMSLVWHFAVQHTERPCRGWIRDIWMDFCEQAARRCMAAREAIPAGQQLDVQYADMNRDWRGTVGRIYEFIGLEFTPAAEKALADWQAQGERAQYHRGHRYALEDFGTSDAEVDARLRFVRERYGIPYENA